MLAVSAGIGRRPKPRHALGARGQNAGGGLGPWALKIAGAFQRDVAASSVHVSVEGSRPGGDLILPLQS